MWYCVQYDGVLHVRLRIDENLVPFVIIACAWSTVHGDVYLGLVRCFFFYLDNLSSTR